MDRPMEELDWPHIEVFKAACRFSPEKLAELEENSSEWIRIYKSLKSYLFIALREKEFSEMIIEILETFTCKFEKMRDACLDESLEIMIKTLHFIYQPDIEDQCKANILKYLETLYFGS
jgi:hypothetical protein